MKKLKEWEDEFYNNNHIRASNRHIALLLWNIFLTVIFVAIVTTETSNTEKTIYDYAVIILLASPFLILHVLLAIGCRRKLILARKGSKIVFALILLGFPVGTFLAMFSFLPTTIWKEPITGEQIRAEAKRRAEMGREN